VLLPLGPALVCTADGGHMEAVKGLGFIGLALVGKDILSRFIIENSDETLPIINKPKQE